MRLIPSSLILLALLTLVAAGCGGGSKTVPPGAVANCNGDVIQKSELDHLLAVTKRRYRGSHQHFPRAGTPQYVRIRDDILQYLVTRCEIEQKADDLGIKVGDKEIKDEYGNLIERVANGDQEHFKRILASQGLTEQDVKDQIRGQLTSRKLQKKITEDVKVSDDDVKKYYEQHKSAYHQPESRSVRHILVKKKALADRIYAELQAGKSFTSLLHFSVDPSAKTTKGQFVVTKGGGFDPAFTKAAFALKTHQISTPVHSQFGWHIIEALGPIKPPTTLPLSKVKQSIRQQLLQQEQNKAAVKWFADLRKEYEHKISYQVGYAPPATTATTTSR